MQLPSNPGGSTEASRVEVFIEGTQPQTPTLLEGVSRGISGLFHKVFGGPVPAAAPGAPASPRPPGSAGTAAQAAAPPANQDQARESQQQKKSGPLKKFFSIFKGGHSKSAPEPPPKQQ